MIVKYSQVFPYWIYGDNKIGNENTLDQWLNKMVMFMIILLKSMN